MSYYIGIIILVVVPLIAAILGRKVIENPRFNRVDESQKRLYKVVYPDGRKSTKTRYDIAEVQAYLFGGEVVKAKKWEL